jgi:hypothetical protein
MHVSPEKVSVRNRLIEATRLRRTDSQAVVFISMIKPRATTTASED